MTRAANEGGGGGSQKFTESVQCVRLIFSEGT